VDFPQAFKKVNGVLRYSGGTPDNGFSLTALAYHADWRSTDQIPERAVERGLIGRFGSLDPTDGGNSQRYALIGEAHQRDAAGASFGSAYVQYYDLDLFSNFTYFLADPDDGDQFEQQDRRVTSGLDAGTRGTPPCSAGRPTTRSASSPQRHVNNGLYQTAARRRQETTRPGPNQPDEPRRVRAERDAVDGLVPVRGRRRGATSTTSTSTATSRQQRRRVLRDRQPEAEPRSSARGPRPRCT
jgi:hypothetical protein